jgi:hypothetical protein
MERKKRFFWTNSDKHKEYRACIASYTVGISLEPAHYCSVCEKICRQMPFIIYDPFGMPVCDPCAEILRLPLLELKESYDGLISLHEGTTYVDEAVEYHWRVGMRKGLRPDFHTKALIDTLCERCGAYGIIESYCVSMKRSPLMIQMTCSYQDENVVENVFQQAETELSALIEGAQRIENYIDFFYVVDRIYYPPGLKPLQRDENNLDRPEWLGAFEPDY